MLPQTFGSRRLGSDEYLTMVWNGRVHTHSLKTRIDRYVERGLLDRNLDLGQGTEFLDVRDSRTDLKRSR